MTVVNEFKNIEKELYKTESDSTYFDCNLASNGSTLVKATTVLNAPNANNGGVLIQDTFNGVIFQMFIASDGQFYTRINWYGSWTVWK